MLYWRLPTFAVKVIGFQNEEAINDMMELQRIEIHRDNTILMVMDMQNVFVMVTLT